jgi:hypothetical protein
VPFYPHEYIPLKEKEIKNKRVGRAFALPTPKDYFLALKIKATA